MQRRTAFTAVAVLVAATIGVAVAVVVTRLSAAFGEIDAFVKESGPLTTRAVAPSGAMHPAKPPATAPAPAPVTVSATAPAAAPPIAHDLQNSAAPTASPSPVDAFLATRADIESRVAAGATPAPGGSLSSADIAGLMASDPQFQSALLDLARDADPEVRRAATRFLAGIEGGDETVAPE